MNTPDQPGAYVGDAFYGDPENSVKPTHQWDGQAWIDLRAEAAQEPATGSQIVERKPTALAADMQSRGILPIIPRDTDEAMRYAKGMIQAGMVPDAYREGGKRDGEINPALVLMGVLKSMELGLPPQTGVATIYPINNRFTVFGDGAIGLVQRHNVITAQRRIDLMPDYDKSAPIGEWPAGVGYRVEYERRGQDAPYVGEYTVGHAKRAGLWMSTYRKPWIQYPDRMLFNRARAFALRDGFADCLMGLAIREEIEDMLPPPEQKAISTSFLED